MSIIYDKRMPGRNNDGNRPSVILRTIVPFLNSDIVGLLIALWRLARLMVSSKVHEGMYEVLEYDTCLELRDVQGQEAVFFKRQRVRFLQNNIVAYQDQAWGDGEIFADYKCSPGVPVDRYRDGHRYTVLISLRGTKNRGDTEEFHIERTIKHGFTQNAENFQTEVNHTTRSLSISVIFPEARLPKSIMLTEQNSTRSIPLGPEHQWKLPDGRLKVQWSTDKPRLFEAYVMRWEW